MLKQIGFVANYEGRSVNSHILVLIRENIELFEKKHGKISEKLDPSLNVRPNPKP